MVYSFTQFFFNAFLLQHPNFTGSVVASFRTGRLKRSARERMAVQLDTNTICFARMTQLHTECSSAKNNNKYLSQTIIFK